MNSSAVLNLFEECGALLQGHFVLSNGLHTDRFVDCARCLEDPKRAKKLAEALVELVDQQDIDKVIAPVMGGVVIGYEVARQLNVPFVYAETDGEGKLYLRKSFSVMPGERTLVVDDVIVRRRPLQDICDVVTQAGGKLLCVAGLVSRNGERVRLPVPLRSLVELDVVTYAQSDCPMCRQGTPVRYIEATENKSNES